MWFRLAALWGCPVAEAQRRIDSREFAEWLAFWRIDPWGPQRADLRIATLAALVANAFRGGRGRPVLPAAFMPFTDKPAPAPAPAGADTAAQQDLLARLGRALDKHKWQRPETSL